MKSLLAFTFGFLPIFKIQMFKDIVFVILEGVASFVWCPVAKYAGVAVTMVVVAVIIADVIAVQRNLAFNQHVDAQEKDANLNGMLPLFHRNPVL